jgi:hypothetical protein
VDAEDRDPVRKGYARAIDGFEDAARQGIVTRRFQIAGHAVGLRLAGPQLAETFAAPWSHLASAEGPTTCDLRIDLWHERETRIPRPDQDDGVDAFSRFPFGASVDHRIVVHRQPETAVWLERQSGHLVGVVGNADRRALYEAGRPVELPLLIWLRDQGTPLAHAALVAAGGRGALIVGKSGSGKSTLAAMCVAEGLAFLGDDKVALTRSAAGFVGHSLTSSLHVDHETLRLIPALTPHAAAPALAIDDKLRVAIERWRPAQLLSFAPISAVIIPRLHEMVEGGIRKATAREALLALSLSTLLSLPIAAERSLDPLADLVERVPAFVVGLTPDAGAVRRVASVLA